MIRTTQRTGATALNNNIISCSRASQEHNGASYHLFQVTMLLIQHRVNPAPQTSCKWFNKRVKLANNEEERGSTHLVTPMARTCRGQ
jgi:hypothetical protein